MTQEYHTGPVTSQQRLKRIVTTSGYLRHWSRDEAENQSACAIDTHARVLLATYGPLMEAVDTNDPDRASQELAKLLVSLRNERRAA